MARDIFYQSVGNPLQMQRLPNHRPELRFPYHPFSASDDSRLAWTMAYLFVLLGIAAMFTQLSNFGTPISRGTRFFTSSNVAIVVAVVILLYRAIADRSVRWLGLQLACIPAAYFYLNTSIPLSVHFLLFAGCVGILSYLFALHWTAYCTASPLRKKTAKRLESQWQGYLLLGAIMPTGLFLFAHLFGSIGFPILATILFFVVQTVLAAPASRNRPFRIASRALVSWLTYNREDADIPGAFQSPAGNWPCRLALTGVCVFLSGIALIHWTYESIVIPFQSSQPLPPLLHAAASLVRACLVPAEGITLLTVFAWMASIALALTLPALLVMGIPAVVNLPILADANQYRCTEVTPHHWEHLVEEVQRSPDPIERQSLYQGRIVHDGSPVILPRAILREHAHFLGDSGGGKTSLGLLPTIEQLITGETCSVIVIDLKADSMELLATALAAARKRAAQTGHPIPVKHFSNQKWLHTFAFNPLLQSFWNNLDLYMKTDIVCGALGLTYGSDYGEGYYSSSNAKVAHYTLKQFPDTNRFCDFAESVSYIIANAKRQELHPEIRKAGIHVQTVLDRLGSFEALNVAPGGPHPQEVLDEAIDLERVFTEPQVVHFHLSSTLGPGSSPEIARLVVYSLLAAATQTKHRHQVYLVIDEFQRMVARNVEYMLQLARSMGVGVILANQSMQDLRTSTADLIPSIEANCRYRQWFAVSSAEDQEWLIRSSGEMVDHILSHSKTIGPNGTSTSIQYQERIIPRLTKNDILLASDHPCQSIGRVSRGDGYAQFGGMPFILESNFHITKDEYERRKTLAWPASVPGAFLPGTYGPATPQSTKAPSKPGPVVTSQIIGSSASSGATHWTNPFASAVQPKAKKNQKNKKRRTP